MHANSVRKPFGDLAIGCMSVIGCLVIVGVRFRVWDLILGLRLVSGGGSGLLGCYRQGAGGGSMHAYWGRKRF